MSLALTTGCDTVSHMLDIVTINNKPASQFVQGIIAELSPQQKAQLQQDSPRTWAKIENNDAAAAGSPQPSAPSANPSQPTATPPAETSHQMQPLTVEDVNALDSAGVKKDVIIAEIGRSKSVYTEADITALQQSNPNIDLAIINCMKNPS
jgi:hypothetical protein